MPLLPVSWCVTPTAAANPRAVVEEAGAHATSSSIILLAIIMLQEAVRGSPFLPLPIAHDGECELATPCLSPR